MTKTFHLPLAAALLLACLLPFPNGATLAAGSQAKAAGVDVEIVLESPGQDPIRSATVNLYCRLRAGRKTFSSSGSGVFIDERGIILTNAHVAQYFRLAGRSGRVKGTCSVRTGSPAKDTYTASLLYMPDDWINGNVSGFSRGTGENDFALLVITGAKKDTLPSSFPALPIDTSENVTEKSRVKIAGYPTENLNFDRIRKELRVITASSLVENIQSFDSNRLPDLMTLAPSDAGSPGISGGPVINGIDAVIGLATSKGVAEEDRTLRAISLSYIDRAIQSQTGLSLRSLLAGDLPARTNATNAAFSQKAIRTLENSLLRRR